VDYEGNKKVLGASSTPELMRATTKLFISCGNTARAIHGSNADAAPSGPQASAARAREATGKAALRAASDDLGSKYTCLADDAAAADKKREAAMLFSVAEGALTDKEDADEALRGAQGAMDLFKEAGDAVGVADSARLMVHAYKAKAEQSYWEIGEAKAEEELRVAEDFAKAQLVKFKDAGDEVGEAAMLLSVAEVIYLLPKDYKRRGEAAESAEQARRTFEQMGASKLEALAIISLFRIAADRLETSKALALATQAAKKLKALGEPALEARALCALAEARQLCSSVPEAIKAVKAALKIFKEADCRKLQAGACLLLAEICLIAQRFKEALGPAKEALAIFEELGYGKGFQPATTALIADVYTQLGETNKAVEVAKEGLAKFEDSGDKRGQVLVGNGLILAYVGGDVYDDGEVDEALKVADRSLSIARDLEDKVWESQVLHTILQLCIRAGDKTKASDVAQEAGALLSDMGDDSEMVLVLDSVAAMQEMSDELDAAVGTRSQQRELCQRMEDKVREGIVMLKIAVMWAQALPVSQEHMDMAMAAAAQAQGLFQEADDKAGEAVAESPCTNSCSMPPARELAIKRSPTPCPRCCRYRRSTPSKPRRRYSSSPATSRPSRMPTRHGKCRPSRCPRPHYPRAWSGTGAARNRWPRSSRNSTPPRRRQRRLPALRAAPLAPPRPRSTGRGPKASLGGGVGRSGGCGAG